MADLPGGAVLGDRFTIVGVLGRGGMATVYLARDALRGEDVALKVLHGHLAARASARTRLRREVASAGRLRHPRALVPWDLHEVDGVLALSMPMHPGSTLAEHVERHGPLTGPALERLARQLADALGAAHAIGLVHRDVTPRNVLIDADGDAMLTDFGLARFVDAATATGTSALGTIGYAAPEGWSGVRADPRADLYGLGAVLHFAATGTPPFGGGDPVAILKRQLGGERASLSSARPDLPPALAALVDRLLLLEPDDRPSCAAEVAAVLDTGELQPASSAASARASRGSGLPGDRASEGPSAPGAGASPSAGSQHGAGRVGGHTGHHLAPGPLTVIVAERDQDKARRNDARNERRRQKNRFEQDVGRAVASLSKTVLVDWLGLEPSRDPEQLLVDAVARAAELPVDSLALPPALWEPRFRLVERVDRETAFILAKAAQDAGFSSEVADAVEVEREPEPAGPLAMLPAALTMVGGLALTGVLGWTAHMVTAEAIAAGAIGGFPLVIPGVVVGLLLTLGATLQQGRRARARAAVPPLAFGRDLRMHLASGADVVLPAPPPLTDQDRREPAGPATQVGGSLPARDEGDPPTPATRSNDPTPAAAPASRATTLTRRAQEQLDALTAALAQAPALPEPARDDLRRTAAALAEHVSGLGERAAALEAELGRLDEAGDAEAVDRIEARLARLRTLQAAGQGEHEAEIAGLTGALQAHRDALARGEELEGQLTLVIARLLEASATAARVRGEILDHELDEGSADDLSRRLGAQSRGASDALRAVRAAAAQRQRG